ncbi:MAG: hypothetical protein DMG06_16400 [Acidobacteria bacterium]|nr:MAG: hypothetical protein DMG06_16400 [Acidobacteriota bacterium]
MRFIGFRHYRETMHVALIFLLAASATLACKWDYSIWMVCSKEAVSNSQVGRASTIKVPSRILVCRTREQPVPAYPWEAKSAGIDGKVAVRIVLSRQGEVLSAQAVSGPQPLRLASEQAARQWKFNPLPGWRVAKMITSTLWFKYFAYQFTNGQAVYEAIAEDCPEALGGIAGSLPGGIPKGVPARVSQFVLLEKATDRAQPRVAQSSSTAGIQGHVTVEVRVSEEGRVVSAEAVSGNPQLHEAAVVAARGWVFRPTKFLGTRVPLIGKITFHFQ